MISTEIRATTTRRTTMKAVVQDTYGSSEVLDLRDIAKPEIREGDVLVRVRAAGVNPGDWAIMVCLLFIRRPASSPLNPYTTLPRGDPSRPSRCLGTSR